MCCVRNIADTGYTAMFTSHENAKHYQYALFIIRSRTFRSCIFYCRHFVTFCPALSGPTSPPLPLNCLSLSGHRRAWCAAVYTLISPVDSVVCVIVNVPMTRYRYMLLAAFHTRRSLVPGRLSFLKD